MSGERRQRLLELLGTALDASPATRPAVLDELCRGDEELRRELETMLALEGEAVGFLDQSVIGDSPPELESGVRLGPYRIVELLGHGGMGAIYRAVREDDFEKQVAIKLIRRDFADGKTFDRFHAERQILARLEHPSIARLLDGGTTADGRPYLVMEHVDGTAVDRYCDDHRLPTRNRLELFRQVAFAVAYAHQNLVVHRDLKPDNILVTADGVPKLLDFGIAKLLAPDSAQLNVVTLVQGPMTPRYASPEQILGEPITAASDVYSLGVLLYQLLTGRLPGELERCGYRELTRRICEHQPLRPSTAVGRPETITTADGPPERTPESVSRVRDGDARRLRRSLAGDVDAIVLKALRKEPRHRYASVEQLTEDIRRHLEGLPVLARKGTWTYRTRKFVRRRRWGIAAALVVLGLSLTSTVLWRRAVDEHLRADRERAEAVRERTRAERVSEFLQDLFKSANPDAAQGDAHTVREILDQGRERLATGLGDEPELRADLAGTLGDVYRNLGLYDEALELLDESLRIRRRRLPEGHPVLVANLNDLASVHYYAGAYEEAERCFREALVMRRRLGQEPAAIARALNNLASALKQQGRYAEAGELYREALGIREELFGPADPNVASSLYSLGALFYDEGAIERAEAPLRRALEIRSAALGERHTRVATVLSTLGRVLHAGGELDEAESLHRRALAIRRELLGDGHAHVALTRRDLAEVLLARGETAAAGELLTAALTALRRAKSPDDWTIADAEGIYGAYLAALGRYQEAEPFVVSSYDAVRAAKGGHSIRTRQARARVAALYEAWGKPPPALIPDLH